MLERKVYVSWAFTENEGEKATINYEIYKEIRNKAKVVRVSSGYAHTEYKVLENPEKLSLDQLALICDGGNLCFGYRVENDIIVIHTD